MSAIFASKALLTNGWADNVRLVIAAGRIQNITTDAQKVVGDVLTDCLIPGLCNAHSHAFQRALAGHTERRSPAEEDNFWSWREGMYALAGKMSPERLQAIARQAYIEMLSSGYTSVAEFHYLHRVPGEDADSDRMFEALCSAADDSGIRLTYVPVLYERAGFEQSEPQGAQQLFALDLESFFAHYERATAKVGDRLAVGIGAHSLRAVSADALVAIAAAAKTAGGPLHLHISEQQREVEDCLRHYGQRPVEWLLNNYDVDASWCLIHATHINDEEISRLAESQAVVCLCPSTEGNLGDGLFPLDEFLRQDGRIAIGSDSHISINPFEELRWLEYGQRLAKQARNIASRRNPHVGHELFERAVEGGAQACGLDQAGLVEGAVADLVSLYGEDPMLTGHDDRSRLDALVFSGYKLPIDGVMVAGAWRVRAGEHERRDESRAAFRDAVSGFAVTKVAS